MKGKNMGHSSVMVVIDRASSRWDVSDRLEQALKPFRDSLATDPFPVRPVTYADVQAVLPLARLTNKDAENMLSIEDPDLEYAFEDYYDEPIRFINGRYMEMSSQNPQGKWEEYKLGGNWNGLLPRKAPETGTNMLQKKHLDVVGAVERATSKANEEYDQFTKVVAGLGTLRPGPSLQELLDANKILPKDDQELMVHKMDSAYDAYNADEWRKAVKLGTDTYYGDPVDIFFFEKGGRQAYVHREVMNAFQTNAILDSDGEWWEKSDLGFDPGAEEEWYEMFNRVIENSDDENWFVICDIKV